MATALRLTDPTLDSAFERVQDMLRIKRLRDIEIKANFAATKTAGQIYVDSILELDGLLRKYGLPPSGLQDIDA